MDNQKGSVKDRLRAKKLFLAYKKSKRKKEIEIEKRKKQEYEERVKAEQIRIYGKPYSKIKAFGLTILGLFFGILTPKSSKRKIQNELEIINKEKKQIFLYLEHDRTHEEIYNKIDNTYQKLDDLKKRYRKQLIINSFDPLETEKLLITIDKEQKELHVINEICHNKENQSKKTLTIKEKETIKPNLSNDYSKKNSVDAVKSKSIENDTQSFISNNPNPLQGTIKNMNNDIKEYIKEIEFLDKKIKEETLYSTLFDYEFKLKQLLKKIDKILEEYDELDEQYNLEELEKIIDIDVIDKFNLRKNNKEIIEKQTKCQNLLKEIENKKEILTSKKSIGEKKEFLKKEKSNKNQTNKIQEKQFEEEKKELKEEFDDIYLVNKMIINNIANETKQINKLKRKIINMSPVLKKRTVFSYAKRFTSSILNIGFSLIPMRFFRNKWLGTLTSGIMLNNSLRTTRRILTLDNSVNNYILYSQIVNEIRSNQDYVSKMHDICLDSLSQIRNIKEHLNANYSMLREYDSELLDFYSQLDNLSYELEKQVNDLEKINNNFKDMKQKVKVRNSYYN